MGAELFHMDRRTDMKLTVAFRNFAKAPKNCHEQEAPPERWYPHNDPRGFISQESGTFVCHGDDTPRQRTRVKAVVVTWWTARVAFQGTGSTSVLQIPNCTFSPASSGQQDVSSDNYLITKRKYANELSNIYVRIETIFYKYTKCVFLRILNPCTPHRSLSTSQILTEIAHEQCDDCGSIPI